MGSIMLASQGQLTLACWLVFAGALFDVFDGLAARALGGGSALGAQLDSLADMVTFGVAPAFLLFIHASSLAGNFFDPSSIPGFDKLPYPDQAPNWPIKAAALALVIGSCWRLAKFNLDTRQTSGFLGVPTPANALFWTALVLVSTGIAVIEGPGHEQLSSYVDGLLGSGPLLLATSIAMTALMLSEVPLPSLKFKQFGWRGNEVILLLAGLSLILTVLYGMLAVPMILLLYLVSPLWGRLFTRSFEHA